MWANNKKYIFLAAVVLILGVIVYWKKREYDNKLVELYNQLAEKDKTTEVFKNAYEKKALEVKDLSDLLKVAEAENARDKEALEKLRKEIDKRDAEILAINRLVVYWKSAYEAEAAANQSEEPPPPDSPPGTPPRVRVDFEKDFGYIGVRGHTLTNPAYAWVKVQQNRPLYLTIAVTQEKDKSWRTTAVSSEENVAIDVKLAGVNPYLFKDKWYEKLMIDVGGGYANSNGFAWLGLGYPIGPVTVSSGLWADTFTKDVGWYGMLNYQFKPFKR